MGSYTFTLDKFHIDDTRAAHNDTDTVSFGVKVGNTTSDPLIKHMGDVNNGDHHVGLQIGPIEIDAAATPVIISYTIVNAGHTNADDQLKSGTSMILAKADGETDMTGTPQDGTQGDSWWTVIWKFAYHELLAWLTADCDGPVATNRIAVTAGKIDEQLGGNEQASFTKSFPGVDSPHGCGGNSRYTVTYSVSRSGPAASQGGHTNVGHTESGRMGGGRMGGGINRDVVREP